MDHSWHIWISNGESIALNNLMLSMPLRYDGDLAVSSLYSHSDMGINIAQHLSTKLKCQIFISCNVPDRYGMHQVKIEALIIEKIQGISAN
jgi:hypothetical protein